MLGACTSGNSGDGGTHASSTVADELAHVRHAEITAITHVSWAQHLPGLSHVAWTADGETWQQTPTVDRAAGQHEQIVLGTPYDTDITWRVFVDAGDGPVASADASFLTGGLPGDFPVPSLLVAEDWDPASPWLFGSISTADFDFYSFIVDRAGHIVWARPTPSRRVSLDARPSLDGTTLLVDHNAFWGAFDSDNSTVERIHIDGSLVHSYPVGDLHFPFVELPDGSIVWGTTNGSTASRTTLRRMDAEGVVSEVFDCAPFYDGLGEVRPCMPNGLSFSEARNCLLMSQWSVNAMIEIGLSGEVQAVFGELAGAWAFAPEEAAFHLSHGSGFTEAGTLLVSTHAADGDEELIVREYALDEEQEQLQQIWSFGEGQGVLGPEAGGVVRLSNGNTLHDYGTGTRLREITPEGDVVWDLDWYVDEEPGEHWLGRVTPLSDLYALVP